MATRSATRSAAWHRIRRVGVSSAKPVDGARQTSTPGIARPRATNACWHARRSGAMPVRVLYLHHVAELSGAERSLRLLLRHADRARVEPLFAGPTRGGFPAALAADGVPMLPLDFGPLRRAGRMLAAITRLVRIVREHRIDLLHAN